MINHAPEVLFIQGVQKTGTSTLVGMLNCHPRIFLLYETAVGPGCISRYGNQLLDRYPDARQFFRSAATLATPYEKLFDYLQKKNPEWSYRYFGDKLITSDPDATQQHRAQRVIFALRDIRSWLCKEPIVHNYRTDLDLVPAAVEYLRYVLGTFRHTHGHRIWLEDLVGHNGEVIRGLAKFLGMSLREHLDRWWEKIGNYDVCDPKSAIDWSSVHPSSRQPPREMDTTFELKPLPFWDEVSAIIDPFRKRGVNSSAVPDEEIDSALQLVEALYRYSPLPLQAAYRHIATARMGITTPLYAKSSSESTSPAARRLRLMAERAGLGRLFKRAG